VSRLQGMTGVQRFVRGLAIGLLPSLAGAQGIAPPTAPMVTVESCVGSERFELHAGADSAVLDAQDRAGVQSAMLERYPAFGRDGAALAAVVLWRKPETGWVYLALKAHPDKPGKLCSAASFAAGVFDFSAALQRKYFLGQRS